jgi:hypothetical protein
MTILVRTEEPGRHYYEAEYDATIELKQEYTLEEMQSFLRYMAPYQAAEGAGVCYRTIKRIVEKGKWVKLKQPSSIKISNFMNRVLIPFATLKTPPSND